MGYTNQIVNPRWYLLDSAHITDVMSGLTHELQLKNANAKRWCCMTCKAFITDDAFIVHIDGNHEHIKVNPQGHTFQFRSYKHTQGCECWGLATAEHSWFSGYSWQFAHCAMCHTQLGWYFSGSDSFFGLIADQIVQCAAE